MRGKKNHLFIFVESKIIDASSILKICKNIEIVNDLMHHHMNTATKLLTSPFLLSIRVWPRPFHGCCICQSTPGHARLKYVLSVNHRQATPPPCVLHKQQQLERVNREKMADFIQLNKPTEPKPASQNREHHPHPPPAKKIRHEEKVFKAKKMNGDTEQQDYSSKPKNKKTKTEKDRDREKEKRGRRNTNWRLKITSV